MNVTGDVGLAAEDVHRLRTGGSRQPLHAVHGHARLRQGLHLLGPRGGLVESQQGGPTRRLAGREVYGEDQTRTGEDLLGAAEPCTRRLIGSIGTMRRQTGIGLHPNLPAFLDQGGDSLR